MPTGKVKWFSPVTGFGFIVQDDVSWKAFVHMMAVLHSPALRNSCQARL